MELIKKEELNIAISQWHFCSNCGLTTEPLVKLGGFSMPITGGGEIGGDMSWLCYKCLTKALLMIRPMELKSMDGADILGYLEMVVEHNIIRNAEEKHLKDMKVFLEWAKQILETKK